MRGSNSGGTLPYALYSKHILNDEYHFESVSNSPLLIVKNSENQELYHVEQKFYDKLDVSGNYLLNGSKLTYIPTNELIEVFPNFGEGKNDYRFIDEKYISSLSANTTSSQLFTLYSLEILSKPADAVPLRKQWKVHFSKAVDPTLAIADYIYVKDSNGQKVPGVIVKIEGKQAIVDAPTEGYRKGERYVLYIDSFPLKNGKKLNNPQMKYFTAW